MYSEWFQYGLDKIISQGQPVFHWSDKTRGDNQQNDQRQHFFHFLQHFYVCSHIHSGFTFCSVQLFLLMTEPFRYDSLKIVSS